MKLEVQLQLSVFGLIRQQEDCKNNMLNELRNANSVRMQVLVMYSGSLHLLKETACTKNTFYKSNFNMINQKAFDGAFVFTEFCKLTYQ